VDPSTGKPTSTVLTSVTVTSTTVPTTTSWVDFVFTTKPVLQAGTQYAIVIGAYGPIDAWNGYAWSIDNDNGYPNGAWMYAQYGTDWSSPGTQDAGFKTYMGAETGEVVSPLISPTNWQDWIEFDAEGNNQGGTIKFDILDSLNNVLVADLTFTDLPYNISTITQSSIKLKAKFAWTAGGTVSPELDKWSVTHHSDYLTFTVDEEKKAVAVRRLADVVGCEWWVDAEGKYYFKQSKGSDKSASVKFEDGVNLISLSFESKLLPFANKIKTVGADKAEGGRYEVVVEDPASQSQYGLYEDVFVDKEIDDEATLTTYAQNLLAKYSQPRKRLRAEVNEIEGLEPGDKVRVVSSRLGIDETLRIERITVKVEGGIPRYTLHLATKLGEVADELLKMDSIERWLK
jgi:hypothetical protein